MPEGKQGELPSAGTAAHPAPGQVEGVLIPLHELYIHYDRPIQHIMQRAAVI